MKCVEEKIFKDFSSCLQMCGKFCHVMLNMSKYVCKKSGGLTTNFVDSRIFKLKNWIFYSLAL